MFVFPKIWRALFSCYLRFEIHPFALITTSCSCKKILLSALAVFHLFRDSKYDAKRLGHTQRL